MWLFRIYKKSTDVGLFDGGEGANSGEFFNTDLALARLSKACSVKDFNGLPLEFDADTIDVAGGSLL